MSLRDQLLAKGLASKKDARRVEQELKAERRAAQGHKRPESEVRAEQEARARAEEEAARQRRIEEKRRREAEAAEVERRVRIAQIIRSNQVRSRGKVRFHHRTLSGGRLGRIEVSGHVAWKLRCGECAVAALSDAEYCIVSQRGAARLAEVAPDRIVHWVRDTRGLSAPEECLLEADWEISLLPHRVR
jgi:uncharacterized protein YaiL (DUF2058 family)